MIEDPETTLFQDFFLSGCQKNCIINPYKSYHEKNIHINHPTGNAYQLQNGNERRGKILDQKTNQGVCRQM